jgi:hypothetical protein
MSDWNLPVKARDGSWTTVPKDDCIHWIKQSSFCKVYDQIDTNPDRIDVLDLCIPAFLDAVPRFDQLRKTLEDSDAFPGRLEEMSEALGAIPLKIELWEWDDIEAHSHLTRLYRACNMPSYKSASLTKMLHRKRPALLPIIDDYVLTSWRDGKVGRWRSEDLADITLRMKEELGAKERQEALDHLMEKARSLGPPWSGLTRLRLFDIVSYWYARSSGST